MTNVITLANVAALRTYTGSAPVIWVEGHTSAADGGEGMFAYVSGATGADNGGTIIEQMSTGNLYFREYNGDPLNICWFGVAPNSSTDTTNPLLNALSALPSQGGTVYFPSGVFTFNESVTYNYPSITTNPVFSVSFVGNGQNATILNWPSTESGTAGIVLNLSSSAHTVHFRDMSITTGYTCSTTGITVNQSYFSNDNWSQSDFIRLTFAGYPFTTDLFPSAYWGFGIDIVGLATVSYDTLLFFMGEESGTAISIAGGSGANEYSVVHNLSKVTTWNGNVALLYGTQLQGVTLSQCSFTDCLTGVHVPSGANGCDQLSIVASQLACIDNAISIQTDFNTLYASSNLFYYPYSGAVAAINITGVVTFASIVGNSFFGLPTGSGTVTSTGIITGPSTSGVISGNVFGLLNIGVDLTGTVGWNVQANAYTGGTVNTEVVGGSGNFVGVATK